MTETGRPVLLSYSRRDPDAARLVATEYGSMAQALRASWDRVGIPFVVMWASFFVTMVGAFMLL